MGCSKVPARNFHPLNIANHRTYSEHKPSHRSPDLGEWYIQTGPKECDRQEEKESFLILPRTGNDELHQQNRTQIISVAKATWARTSQEDQGNHTYYKRSER